MAHILHQETHQYGPTVCGQPVTVGNVKTSLGHAINSMAYSPQSVLCVECFLGVVGDIRFDRGPTWKEYATDQAAKILELTANQDNEIIDAEIMEEE